MECIKGVFGDFRDGYSVQAVHEFGSDYCVVHCYFLLGGAVAVSEEYPEFVKC